jgi:hypothetical protein
MVWPLNNFGNLVRVYIDYYRRINTISEITSTRNVYLITIVLIKLSYYS